jgi:hypothetical protein
MPTVLLIQSDLELQTQLMYLWCFYNYLFVCLYRVYPSHKFDVHCMYIILFIINNFHSYVYLWLKKVNINIIFKNKQCSFQTKINNSVLKEIYWRVNSLSLLSLNQQMLPVSDPSRILLIDVFSINFRCQIKNRWSITGSWEPLVVVINPTTIESW